MNLRILVGLAVCGWVVGMSGQVSASEGDEEGQPRVMVVVGTGKAASAEAVIEEEVVAGAELMIKGDWSWERGEVESSLWDGLGAEAEEIYFFQGAEELVSREGHLWQAYLKKRSEAWEDDARMASIQQALLYGIRARLDLGHHEEARELMEGLLERWPGSRPDEERHPPSITALWESVSENETSTTEGKLSSPGYVDEAFWDDVEGEELWELFEELAERYALDALIVVARGDCGETESGEMSICMGQISPHLLSWRPLKETTDRGAER